MTIIRSISYYTVYLFWITSILIFLYPYRKVISVKLRIFSCIMKILVYCKGPPILKKEKILPVQHHSSPYIIPPDLIVCIFDEKNGLHYGSFITFLPSSHEPISILGEDKLHIRNSIKKSAITCHQKGQEDE